MSENDLYRIILPLLRKQFSKFGLAGIELQRGYQSTRQGAPVAPTLILHKISDYRYGHPSRDNRWDKNLQQIIYEERVMMITKFQVNALAIDDTHHTQKLTASDIINQSAMLLQHQTTLDLLRAAGIGIERITDIRHPYFLDDSDRFEAQPSFDFNLSHESIYRSENPVVESIEAKIYRV